MKLTALITLSAVGLLSVPTQALAFDFQMGGNETTILNDDFETGAGWQLSNTLEIQGGVLSHKNSGSYGRASYRLDNPLNLNDGAINLYWVGAFPEGAHKERDAYWPSLQYANNPAVCWKSSTNEVVALGANGQCDSGYLKVDEDSEVRVWLRPDKNNIFNRLYVDPGFDPGIDPEGQDSPLAHFKTPDHPDSTAEQYRLRLEQTDGVTEAVISYWNGTDWQDVNGTNGRSLPLQIDASDWIDIDDVLQGPIFEALNFQFRGPGPSGIATGVSAVALTQELSNAEAVPEPGVTLGLVALAGIGFGHRKKSRR